MSELVAWTAARRHSIGWWVVWVAGLSVAPSGCTEHHPEAKCGLLASPSEGIPIIRVGPVIVTRRELLDAMQKAYRDGRLTARTDAAVQSFVDDVVRIELLTLDAVERGLLIDSHVRFAVKRTVAHELLAGQLADEVLGARLNDEAILAHFEKYRDRYAQPERREIFEWLVTTEPRDGLSTWFGTPPVLMKSPPARGQPGVHGEYLEYSDAVRRYGEVVATELFAAAEDAILPYPIRVSAGIAWVGLWTIVPAQVLPVGVLQERLRRELLSGTSAEVFDRYLVDLQERYPVVVRRDELARLTTVVRSWEPSP